MSSGLSRLTFRSVNVYTRVLTLSSQSSERPSVHTAVHACSPFSLTISLLLLATYGENLIEILLRNASPHKVLLMLPYVHKKNPKKPPQYVESARLTHRHFRNCSVQFPDHLNSLTCAHVKTRVHTFTDLSVPLITPKGHYEIATRYIQNIIYSIIFFLQVNSKKQKHVFTDLQKGILQEAFDAGMVTAKHRLVEETSKKLQLDKKIIKVCNDEICHNSPASVVLNMGTTLYCEYLVHNQSHYIVIWPLVVAWPIWPLVGYYHISWENNFGLQQLRSLPMLQTYMI